MDKSENLMGLTRKKGTIVLNRFVSEYPVVDMGRTKHYFSFGLMSVWVIKYITDVGKNGMFLS